MISKIYPWLYIGNCSSGSSHATHRHLSIKTIVNVHEEHKNSILTDIKCFQIPLVEAPGNEWRTVVKILNILDDNRIHGSVLVHCCGAVSRSPFVVLCYMVTREKMTIYQAFRRLSHLHPTTSINPNLMELLQRNASGIRS
ncbi:MAG: dual specificity protein phosphatase family protein [Thaumarchaeota archaeon]|nr:dual specificity protein phosphatase family protein [Nitrososphaerota archaeon]